SFHEAYYHPSNALIFFYGDDDPEERLRMLNKYLKDFKQRAVDSKIPLQERLDGPRRLSRMYAVGEEAGEGSKGMITLNWLLNETKDGELNLAFHMLEFILLGMPGSPLRKALIDSKYGEDLAGVGLASELRQMYFSTGLKGIDPAHGDDIEALILETLTGLVNRGIDPRTVEAAQNTVEFILRENNTGNYPRGLVLMLRALTTWLYDDEPLALVAFESPLRSVKAKIGAEEAFFETLIDEHFLKNTHWTQLLLRPDPAMAKKEEAAEQERLAEFRSSLGASDLQQLIDHSAMLRQMQETPDSPRDLAAIPTLKLSDLSKLNKTIPLRLVDDKEAQILYHDLFTSGIVYLDVGFDLHALPQKYLPYVPLFGRALLEMGTEKEDFVTLAQRISRKTGGISPGLHTAVVRDSEQGTAWLFLRGKAMMAESGALLSILSDVLLTARLDNQERFRQMVLEAKARHEHKLVPSGHQIVNMRLRSHFNEADWAEEQMRGINQLIFLRKLARSVEEDWPGVLSDLEAMRRILVNRKGLLVNVTMDETSWLGFQPRLGRFLEALPVSPFSMTRWDPQRPEGFEGLTIPAQVNYVGKAVDLYALGYQFHGSAQVISRYLRNAWLWEAIRVKGGAYGAFCLFDRLSGILTFVSYRDPNLLMTLDAMDDSARFLRNIELTGEELPKAIIGTIGDLDQYQLPDAKGYTSMARYLSGTTDQERQRIREEVLGTTIDHFRSFGDILEKALEGGLVKVLGSQSAIEKAAAERPGWLKVRKVL
ncbi:MAG: insulinase family protein, partial [Proteobacteria bacterium]|nr:insulinase family protein [Pseudomonadota bacterium]